MTGKIPKWVKEIIPLIPKEYKITYNPYLGRVALIIWGHELMGFTREMNIPNEIIVGWCKKTLKEYPTPEAFLLKMVERQSNHRILSTIVVKPEMEEYVDV